MSVLSLRLLTGLLCAASACTAVLAADNAPSFNYAAVHYQEFEADNGRNFDGINLEISGHLSERWFISGSYAQIDSDADNASIDRDLTYGRLGYLAHHQRRLAVYAGPQIMYVSYEIPFTSSTDSDTSVGAFAGVRYMMTPSIELKGELNYASFSHGDSSNFTQYTVGLRTFLSYRFALEARAQLGDWEGFMLGASIHF